METSARLFFYKYLCIILKIVLLQKFQSAEVSYFQQAVENMHRASLVCHYTQAIFRTINNEYNTLCMLTVYRP